MAAQNSTTSASSSPSASSTQSSASQADSTQTQSSRMSGAQQADRSGDPGSSQQNALEVLRGSVVNVLDSVVREYEPQIASFTANIAHEAVDRGVSLAQTAVARVRAQSWVRIGIAAALGVGIIAVLGYEAEQAATATTRKNNNMH